MKLSDSKIRAVFAALAVTIALSSFGQGATLSPYSQYGLGELAQQGASMGRGLNGLGIGFHRSNQVNPLNPASYSSVDSITMLFDVGLSGQTTQFKENGNKLKANTANFEYAMGSFRLYKNVGVTFGIQPFTNVGYKYSATSYLQEVQTSIATTHKGDGGLHQLFLGVGARPFKPLSVGVNAGYLWGGYDRTVSTSTSTSTVNSLAKYYRADVNSYTLDFGLQYDQPIGKEDLLTVGLTYGFGHKLGADAECLVVSTNSTVSKADTTRFTLSDALSLPHTFGAGLSYTHGQQWMVGADAQLQRWGKTDFPDYQNGVYAMTSNALKDSYRFTLGGEYTPRYNSRNFFQRIRYRVGVGYATPYYKINGQDGPRQISATVGFGIPIFNGYYANRPILSSSVLNISAQWLNSSADGLIKENTFRINIGLTFNERWFAKWRVE